MLYKIKLLLNTSSDSESLFF